MKVALGVFALVASAMVGAFVAGIWSGDERWFQTGVLGAVLTIITGGIAGGIAGKVGGAS